ncbi:MAG: late competence development ComFB family protein [Spirochaetaceae bacterium]|jgi:competence protein ComFB|nr:late competence development ComFB family protein [Spirochaetaceae bacterium]
MEIHNVMEELVFSEVDKVCAVIKQDKIQNVCTCAQCRLDAACYALNRLEPHYIVSSRGILREEHFDVENMQKLADITSLVYQGLRQVNINRRPGFDHYDREAHKDVEAAAYFNIPVIIGSVFNGRTFEPVAGIDVGLLLNCELAQMKDANWQNPCRLIKKTEGSFTFWPISIPAKKAGEQKIFKFSVKAPLLEGANRFPALIHHFELSIVSEKELVNSIAMNRTHKISDLYMFDIEEGEENANGVF